MKNSFRKFISALLLVLFLSSVVFGEYGPISVSSKSSLLTSLKIPLQEVKYVDKDSVVIPISLDPLDAVSDNVAIARDDMLTRSYGARISGTMSASAFRIFMINSSTVRVLNTTLVLPSGEKEILLELSVPVSSFVFSGKFEVLSPNTVKLYSDKTELSFFVLDDHFVAQMLAVVIPDMPISGGPLNSSAGIAIGDTKVRNQTSASLNVTAGFSENSDRLNAVNASSFEDSMKGGDSSSLFSIVFIIGLLALFLGDSLKYVVIAIVLLWIMLAAVGIFLWRRSKKFVE